MLRSLSVSMISSQLTEWLALVHMNYSMELDLDGVINIFAEKHPRRLPLGNVFSDIVG